MSDAPSRLEITDHSSGALSVAQNLVRSEPTWLHALYSHDPGYDPWPDVPDEIRSQIREGVIDLDAPGFGPHAVEDYPVVVRGGRPQDQ